MSPVADFFGANGPAEIVRYNWNKLRGAWHQPLLATIEPRTESFLHEVVRERSADALLGQKGLRAGQLRRAGRGTLRTRGVLHGVDVVLATPACRGRPIPGSAQKVARL